LGNIQTKLKTYNLRPYTPPDEYSSEILNHHWAKLLESEGKRKRAVTSYIREVKDKLRKAYADAANGFLSSVNAISDKLTSLQGELESQLSCAKELFSDAEPLKESLGNVSDLDHQCMEASIDDNEYKKNNLDTQSILLKIYPLNLVF
jgi:hypothetical protein